VNFVLVDNTNGATTADGSALTPDVFNQIAVAATVYLNRDLAMYWGIPIGAQVRTSDGTDIQDGEWVFVILPALPNAPDAVAYHDVNGNGAPVLFDAITLSNTLIGSGNSLSVAITHELAETAVDEACNAWRDAGDGTEHAQEACDAVESSDYTIDVNGAPVAVSNFVLPAFFNPTHAGPYDKMTLLGAPFTTMPGAYQIVRTPGSNEQQITARVERRVEKRKHWSSRSYRRGLRLA
jgi:hypothetical protein